MRIELTTEGGFAAVPGLQRPMRLDCAALSPEQAAQCEALVRAVAAEPVQAEPSAMRDGRRYTLRIDDGGRTLLFSATDMTMAPGYRGLLEFVRLHGAR